MLLAILSAYLTRLFMRWNDQGIEWAGAAAFVAAALSLSNGCRLYLSMQSFFIARRRFNRFIRGAEKMAEARTATINEIENAGLLGDNGVLQGVCREESGQPHDVRFNGEGSMLLLGPAKANKSTSVIISSLFPHCGKGRRKRSTGLGHNALVYDPNGEIYAIMRNALQQAGIRTVPITPFHAELSRLLKVEIPDAGLNVCSGLNLQGDPRTIRSAVVDMAALYVPDDPRMEAKDKYFHAGGKTVAEFLEEYSIAAGKEPHPPVMHALVSEGPAGIIERCREAADHEDALGGALAKRARSVLGYATSAPEQFAGYLGACEQGLRLYDSAGVFGSHFTPHGFDPAELKGDEPLVAFLMYPTQKASSHQQALNLSLTYCIERLAADPRTSRRVTLLIDECANCGYCPVLPRCLNEYRKFGIRAVLAFQELAGQTERIYGASAVKEILAAAEVIWASNVREPASLEMLSQKCGEASIEDGSLNDGRSDGPQTCNYGRSHKHRPLWRPDDIRRFGTNRALVIAGNLHPMVLEKVPYWTRPEWNEIAAPNPYRQS